MRIAALIEHPDHVCGRYRLAAFRAVWTSVGHTLELHALPKTFAGRLHVGAELRDADLVILQRKLLPPWQLALLRRRVRRLVFDFDDAVWLRDSYAARRPGQPRHMRRFAATVRACDAVVAGNEFLRDHAARFTDPARVVVVPTCVEPAHYPTALHGRRDGVQLVWVGSSSTLRGLVRARALLEAIGRACPGVGLTLICDQFLQLEALPVRAVRWSRTEEPAQIAAGDIGISWLPDDDWSRGKCGLKVLQYQAAGLPIIANPVGVQCDFVRPGETGFLVTTADEWIAAVRALAASPELRQRFGETGRRRVEREYSVTAGAQAWNALFARLAPSRAEEKWSA